MLVCDVLDPTTGEPCTRDPRGIAQKGGRDGQDPWGRRPAPVELKQIPTVCGSLREALSSLEPTTTF